MKKQKFKPYPLLFIFSPLFFGLIASSAHLAQAAQEDCQIFLLHPEKRTSWEVIQEDLSTPFRAKQISNNAISQLLTELRIRRSSLERESIYHTLKQIADLPQVNPKNLASIFKELEHLEIFSPQDDPSLQKEERDEILRSLLAHPHRDFLLQWAMISTSLSGIFSNMDEAFLNAFQWEPEYFHLAFRAAFSGRDDLLESGNWNKAALKFLKKQPLSFSFAILVIEELKGAHFSALQENELLKELIIHSQSSEKLLPSQRTALLNEAWSILLIHQKENSITASSHPITDLILQSLNLSLSLFKEIMSVQLENKSSFEQLKVLYHASKTLHPSHTSLHTWIEMKKYKLLYP
jgi:hypothetical protein